MRAGISIEVSAADRGRLERIVADRNSPQKHVWRARIILATAEGCSTAEVMRRAEVSKPCVWRWQERFMREGGAGLVRDKTRKPGLQPLPPAVVERVVALTLSEPPGATTHWSGRAMAAAVAFADLLARKAWSARRLTRLLAGAEARGLVGRAAEAWALTDAGLRRAAEVARGYRLWELFLTEYPDQAGLANLAHESVEALLPPPLVEELTRKLGARGRWPGGAEVRIQGEAP